MRKDNLEIANIKDNANLLYDLYSQKHIPKEALEYGLNILYPLQWGKWALRLLLILGVAFLFCGFSHFFVFNWEHIPLMTKLFSIEITIVICVIASYFYSFEGLTGRLFLLAASILVGVFLNAFNHIYQINIRFDQFFIIWAILTFGWTLLSNFAIQWFFWLIISNIGIFCYYHNNFLDNYVYLGLISFNGIFLVLREYFVNKKGKEWLAASWIRFLLLSLFILTTTCPIICLTISEDKVGKTDIIACITAVIGHFTAYYFYRYKSNDLWAIAVIITSFSVIITFCFVKFFLRDQNIKLDNLLYLVSAVSTLIIFNLALFFFLRISKEVKFSQFRFLNSSKNKHYDLSVFLNELGSKFAINQEILNSVINRPQNIHFYLSILVVVGAFIVFLYLLFFIFKLGVITNINKYLITAFGLLSITFSIFFKKFASIDKNLKDLVCTQLSVVFMLLGKTLFCISLAFAFHSIWLVILGLFVINVITYCITFNWFESFISCFALLFMIFINLYLEKMPDYVLTLILSLFFIFQLISAITLLHHNKVRRDYIAIAYALLASASFMLLPTVLVELSLIPSNLAYINDSFSNIFLTSVLMALLILLAGDKLKTKPLLFAAVIIPFLGVFFSSFLLLAIIIMLLGHAKHEILLTIAGTLLLIIFLYCLSMNIFILKETSILIASGFILLILHFYLKKSNDWDKKREYA